MTAGPIHGSQRPPSAWAPWAAAVWAAGFAAGNLYLAAGGTGGLGLVAAAIENRIRARDPAMVAALWVTGGLKLAAAALALSTLHAWSGWGRRGLLVLVGTAGVLFELWGGADVVLGALVASHTLQAPAGWGPESARWYLLLWGPLWLLGGGLFLASARHLSRHNPLKEEGR